MNCSFARTVFFSHSFRHQQPVVLRLRRTMATNNFSGIIEPAALNGRLSDGNLRLVDTRDEADFKKDHIQGAVNISQFFYYLIEDSKPETHTKLQKHFSDILGKAGVSESNSIVVYEDSLNTSKGASCRGYFLLKYLGVKDVSVLNGGLQAWKHANLPVVSAEEKARDPVEFKVNVNNSILVDRAGVESKLNDSAVFLLDNRDADEWKGLSSSPYGVDFCPRKGRIPGAVWIEWYKFMKIKDGVQLFKSPEEVRQVCADAGLTDLSKQVQIYCFKGARASNTFLAMEAAGFTNLSNYFASWNEWSRDEKLPIDGKVLE